MTRLRLTLAAIAAAFTATTASADFTFTAPGPLITAGAAGNPGNGTFTQNFPGPGALWGQLNFNGNISPLVAGTWVADATFRITTPNVVLNYTPSNMQTYPANTPVVASTGVFLFGTPGNYTFEATDTFDDGAGDDAVWNSASFNFVDLTATALGTLQSDGFVFDTNGSDYDTELGLYRADGTLLANDDDGGAGLQSLINSGYLDPGSYFILAGGFNSGFGNGVASAGNASGNLLLNINGVNYFNGASTSGQFQVFQLDVTTPAPAAVWMGVIGVGALAGLRRRFKKA